MHIYRLNLNKSPLKITGNIAVGVLRDSRKFSEHPYRAHRAVIFAIAQLACILTKWLQNVIGSSIIRSVAVAKKHSHGHVITLGLPMALLDAEISAVWFFAVCCGWAIHPTAKVSEEVNVKYRTRNTMVQLSTPYTPTLSATMHSV